MSPVRRSHVNVDITNVIFSRVKHVPYVFDHAVYVRWGASLFMPSTFPRKGRGVGPGGSGGLPGCAGDRDRLSFRAPATASSTTASPSKAMIIMWVRQSEPRKIG